MRWRSIAAALAVAITLAGGLLRLDAFVSKYGTLDHPRWARVATRTIAPLVKAVTPRGIGWAREPNPYVGGDPINYLKYGREMTSFYQPHVREPVFLALTRGSLWALDGQDAGVSLASIIGSTLAIVATYLVGAALLSPLAGLLGAALAAIEFDLVTWAPDGWRDDTFMATVLFTAWALLRLRARPSRGNAVLAGVLAAVSCLTRITALSFILPALAWLIADGARAGRAERARAAGLAAVVTALLVAPYLVSCAIATGDPFLAINYHTTYYRYAEHQSIDTPMSAAGYIGSKIASRPVAAIDTGFNGLLVRPFVTKWDGFRQWMPGLGTAARWLAVPGLAALLFFPAGRLLLVTLVASLVPYMFTWNVGGGDAWRFTMHAYPFFLIASAVAVVGLARGVRAFLRHRAAGGRLTVMPLLWRTGVAMALAAVGVAVYVMLPWFVLREALADGEATSIETGPRDAVFYRSGWSVLLTDSIAFRVSRGARSTVRFPLPEQRAYDLVLRIDPVTGETPEHVDVLFNKRWIARLRLSLNPERVGSYRLTLARELVHAGENEMILIPATTVPAAEAGARFASLAPADRIGVRLWYIRVLP